MASAHYPAGSPPFLPTAEKPRLNERTGSVAARVLKDLELSRAGRDISKALGGRPASNAQKVTVLMNQEINDFAGIPRNAWKTLSADQAEAALEALDEIGDRVRDRISEELGAD